MNKCGKRFNVRLCLVAGLLLTALLCTACGKKKSTEGPTNAPTESLPTTQAATPTMTNTPTPTEEPTPTFTPTPTPDPHEGMVRSSLTNEWVTEEVKNSRPIAVMMNNLLPGTPQSGINRAGVVYECKVEGNITRLLAIIEDWSDMPKIGSVRSARTQYIFWQMEWDSIYLHFGCSFVTQPMLNRSDVYNLDGMLYEGSVYYRSKDRVAPHNAYASTDGVLKGVEFKKYSLTHGDRFVSEHFQFAPDDNPTVLLNGVDARIVRPGYEENTPWFEYNASEGIYYRFQYGKEHIDNVDNKQITCTNIIIQITNSGYESESPDLKTYNTIDKNMPGYFITGGKAVPITWTKESESAPTRYYYENGTEIRLNTGKTWICVVRSQDAKTVKIEP
jgi:hypothetical protein